MKYKCICYFSPIDVCIGFGMKKNNDFIIYGNDVKPDVDAYGFYEFDDTSENPIGQTVEQLSKFAEKNSEKHS